MQDEIFNKISFGVDSRDKIKAGIDKVANAVKTTLGPSGRNVAIQRQNDIPHITKDGVTVAKNINLKDPEERVGADLIKTVAENTVKKVGDGTSTSAVLAQAILNKGMKFVSQGANAIDIQRGINKATDRVIGYLNSVAIDVSSVDDIRNIATVSSNDDETIGNMIADAFDRVGQDGAISVQESQTTKDVLEFVEGFQFDQGYISPYFITNEKKGSVELENPYILFYDGRINSIDQIKGILQEVLSKSRALLVVAHDVTDQALHTLMVNKLKGVLKTCAVKAPAYGERRKKELEDMAVLTGGKLIAPETGTKLENVTLEDLGEAGKVTLDDQHTVIIDGQPDTEALGSRLESIKYSLENDEMSEFDREKLKDRYAKLTNGVAIIRVGASSEAEVQEKKDRIEDAIYATKAAIEEGIIAGGGTIYIKATRDLQELIDGETNPDYKLGMSILKESLLVPTKTIVDNTNIESGEVVVRRVYDEKEVNIGFDARAGEYTDLISKGIIDPVKVSKTALQNAVSVSGLVLTTDTLITEEPKEAVPEIHMNMAGGMA